MVIGPRFHVRRFKETDSGVVVVSLHPWWSRPRRPDQLELVRNHPHGGLYQRYLYGQYP